MKINEDNNPGELHPARDWRSVSGLTLQQRIEALRMEKGGVAPEEIFRAAQQTPAHYQSASAKRQPEKKEVTS